VLAHSNGIIIKRKNRGVYDLNVFFEIFGEFFVIPSVIGVIRGNCNGKRKLFGCFFLAFVNKSARFCELIVIPRLVPYIISNNVLFILEFIYYSLKVVFL